MTRRTKIVCTLGPATGSPEPILALAEAGMDVARLNFSHGSHDEHRRSCEAVRAAATRLGRPIAVLADLQGPKIRLGTFAGGCASWCEGDEVVLTTERVEGSARRVSVDFAGLPGAVRRGDRLLVDDGNLALDVAGVKASDICCRVVEGGPVSDHKGLSVPGRRLEVPALSDKDEDDLRFAVRLGADLVALSFVQRPGDAGSVRRVLAETGSPAAVIAKIERPQAVSVLAAILEAFDGIMLARGDLGVEMPLEQVPLVQRRAIQAARRASKPVIVATQMLGSMVSHSRPTRAEVTDVSTAVFEGADAMMLSAETSVGSHAREAVATMARIVEAAESEAIGHAPAIDAATDTRAAALVQAAVEIAGNLGARALVAFTETGATARRIARHRPAIPIIAFTPFASVRQQLALSWGVETFVVPEIASTDAMVCEVERYLVEAELVARGDDVVILAGTPIGRAGSTNTVRVERIGASRVTAQRPGGQR